MKCANPTCNHSIGLVSHRRGLFGKRPYCSKACRDHLAVAPAPKCERANTEPTTASRPPLTSSDCGVQSRPAIACTPKTRKNSGVAMAIAAGICIYTNDKITLEKLDY